MWLYKGMMCGPHGEIKLPVDFGVLMEREWSNIMF